MDDYAADIRSELGLEPEDYLILQPTRIVPRKGIEHAMVLLRMLNNPRCKLVFSHEAGDEGLEYLDQLMELAQDEHIDVRSFGNRIADLRELDSEGRKMYVLEDLYQNADLVTFPSLYEGFGNAFLEAVYFRVPIVVNRYQVFARDIEPKGFSVPLLDGLVTRKVVQEVRRILEDMAYRQELVDHNYAVAKKYYNYSVLRYCLQKVFVNIQNRLDGQ